MNITFFDNINAGAINIAELINKNLDISLMGDNISNIRTFAEILSRKLLHSEILDILYHKKIPIRVEVDLQDPTNNNVYNVNIDVIPDEKITRPLWNLNIFSADRFQNINIMIMVSSMDKVMSVSFTIKSIICVFFDKPYSFDVDYIHEDDFKIYSNGNTGIGNVNDFNKFVSILKLQ